jgi:hypothetical protein
MLEIIYPEPGFRTRSAGGKDQIFDSFRKKWLSLTPEEWVRQNFIQYLVREKAFPPSLIALEKVIQLGELRKRFDILVYDAGHRPWLMVECKAPHVMLDDTTVQQVLRYNLSTPVRFIVVTNGPVTYGWERNSSGLEPLLEIPRFGDPV